MKFRVLYKHEPEVVNYFNEHKGYKYGNGACLKRFDSRITNYGLAFYAFCCEGSFWTYLYHKIKYRKYTIVMMGW